jgi:hypothetical protein
MQKGKMKILLTLGITFGSISIFTNIVKLISDFNDGTFALVVVVGILTSIQVAILKAIIDMEN